MQFGRYLLVEKLAEGGMAEIFKAKTMGIHGFEKILVVKRILPERARHPEFVDMFIAEAKMMVKLSHPKIVDVLDFGHVDGHYFIAMEYVRGIDCAQLLRTCAMKQVRPSPVIAVNIVADVLDALHYAHHLQDEEGRPLKIVHRDVSPSNVFISEHGEVKLSDFGIATIGTRRGRSEGGIVRGKYGYLAPEVVTGGPVDQRADVFSAGILLAELLMVQRLFYSENYVEILVQVRNASLDRLERYGRHIPEELREILLYALARSPSLRYQTAGAFRNALNHYLFDNQMILRSTSVRRFLNHIGDEPQSIPVKAVPVMNIDQNEKTTEPSPVKSAGNFKRSGKKTREYGEVGKEVGRYRKRKTYQPPPELDPLSAGGLRKSAMARLSAEEAFSSLTPVEKVEVDSHSQLVPPKSLDLPSGDLEQNDLDAASLPEVLNKGCMSSGELVSLPAPDWEYRLEERSLFSVLFSLAVDMENGLLLLRRGEEIKEIYLRDGDPFYVASNRLDELFGQYLLAGNVITESELKKALSVLHKYEGKLGETLVALKILRPVQMLRLLTEQVRHKMLQAFEWDAGECLYYSNFDCKKDAVPLGLDAFELIEAGVKAMKDSRLSKCLAPFIHKKPMQVSPPPVPPDVFRVDGIPRQVYDSLDGRRTVAEMLNSDDAVQDPASIGRIIYMLLECGMVRI